MSHGFGRIPSPPDERDYKLSTFIEKAPLPKKKFWSCDMVLDQGASPHCVGFSFASFGNALPVDSNMDNTDGHNLYYMAKMFDGEPGAENGSNMRSGAKAMQMKGRIKNYAFAKKNSEIITWVLTKGPVVVGTDWFNDMFYPNKKGFVRPTGRFAGGHAYLILGVDLSNPLLHYYLCLNSWGYPFGLGGFFKITVNNFGILLARRGEVIAAVELPNEKK